LKANTGLTFRIRAHDALAPIEPWERQLLSTIGYEGASPADFLKTLLAAEVEVVIDVRDRAQSRRPGFSKGILERSLAESGIDYFHLRELGDPKEGRDAARANDFTKFRRIFESVLATSSAQAAIAQIASIAAHSSVCLLCYERDPERCHRTIVADLIAKRIGMKVRKLGVRTFEPA
jgi:uncharacterized protein (DUF488 family)